MAVKIRLRRTGIWEIMLPVMSQEKRSHRFREYN